MARIGDLLAAGRTFSFEFFPPSTEAGWMTLGRTIAELEPLGPSFVSVTYGAGGTTRARTHEVVTWIGRETNITPMAHLTCVSHTKSEITEIVTAYKDAGVDNILTLGGDPSKDTADTRPSDFRYASELLDHVRTIGSFSIGVAAHPEGHPKSPDLASDRARLAEKLRCADFAITQFFFDSRRYTRLVDELAALGVEKAVIPGIMPVTNARQVARMAELSGAEFPGWLADRVAAAGDDAREVARVGVDAATELSAELLAAGAPGLHFYTLNRSTATREIWTNLGLASASN